MIEQKIINVIITEGLREATGCEIVKSNLAGTPIPSYPYISFTILNSDTKKGTYSVGVSGRYISVKQNWSFTVQGKDDDEAFRIALLAKDWLEETGRRQLGDQDVIVESVGAITNRDTFLTVDYEYRKGFDVVLSLMNIIKEQEKEIIEQIEIKKE